MPHKELFGESPFQLLEKKLLKRGFSRMHSKETRPPDITTGNDSRAPPQNHDEREVGFFFRAKGLTVVVWTSYIESVQQARDSDNGWVLIKQGNKVLYYSRPMNRTKTFLRRLFISAAIAQVRIQKRPECPACGCFMQIVRGNGMGSRYWSCFRHPKRINLGWDDRMPEAAMPYVLALRDKRQPYMNKVKEKGSSLGKARTARSRRKRS